MVVARKGVWGKGPAVPCPAQHWRNPLPPVPIRLVRLICRATIEREDQGSG
jgi:hypothetical protein